MMPEFEHDGARHVPAVYGTTDIETMTQRLADVLDGRPGIRVTDRALCEDLGVWGPLWETAAGLIGGDARPVRVVVFDKTPASNWALPWHQDRTIAVRQRVDVPGFGPWSTKDGIPHVEPPVDLLAGMVTLRLHLDDCGPGNAPLDVALGSHRLGLIPADRAAAVAEALPLCTCVAAAGDVWAYSTLILHRSSRSRMSGHRRVVQVDYAAIDLPNGMEWYGFGGKSSGH